MVSFTWERRCDGVWTGFGVGISGSMNLLVTCLMDGFYRDYEVAQALKRLLD